jgi:hypothetical protein
MACASSGFRLISSEETVEPRAIGAAHVTPDVEYRIVQSSASDHATAIEPFQRRGVVCLTNLFEAVLHRGHSAASLLAADF